MNPDSPIDPRAATESSLTALLLGELPHEQAAALHQKLAQDAELAKLYERLKQTIDLVRETVASPAAHTAGQPAPLKLSDERRQKLLQQFKTVAPKEFARPQRRVREWLVPVGIAAALVLIMAAIAVPNFVKARNTSHVLALRLPAARLASEEGDGDEQVAKLRRLSGGDRVQREARERSQISGQVDSLESGRAAVENFRLYGSPDLNRNGRREPSTAKDDGLGSDVPLVPHSKVAIPASKPTGTGIVLPKGAEVADATTTTIAAEGVNNWSASGTLRGQYYDNVGRADGWEGNWSVAGGGGGSGGYGGGGYGGGAGSTPGKTSDADGRKSEVAADNWSFPERNGDAGWAGSVHRGTPWGDTKPAPTVADDSSRALPPVAAGSGSMLGADGQPLPREPQSHEYISRNAFIAPPPTTANGTVEAPAPAESAGKMNLNYANVVSGDAGSRVVLPATGPQNAGEAFRSADAPRPDSANKPANTTVSGGTALGITTLAGINQPLRLAPTAPATPPAGPASAPVEKSKLALAPESRPYPTSSYYGGGAYSGYSKLQPAPSGGDKGVAQSRPVLRSPKEGGPVGGGGSAVGERGHGVTITGGIANVGDVPATEKPAATTVDRKRIDRLGAAEPLSSGESRLAIALPGLAPAHEEQPKLALADTAPSGAVTGPGALNQEAFLHPTQPSAPSENKDKVLGFNWYMGDTVVNNGGLTTAASTGTAPSPAGQAQLQAKTEQPPAPSEPVVGAEHLVPLELKLPPPAFKGTPSDLSAMKRYYRIAPGAGGGGVKADTEPSTGQVPILGDLPLTGRLFRNDGSSPTPQSGGKSEEAETFQNQLAFVPQGDMDKDRLGVDLYANQSSDPNASLSKQGGGTVTYSGTTRDDISDRRLLDKAKGVHWDEEVGGQAPAAPAGDKGKASTLVRDGKLLYEMGKLDDADAKLKEALKEDPHNEAAQYYLNLDSEAKFRQAGKAHEVTMRQDIRAVEQAWASPATRERLPTPGLGGTEEDRERLAGDNSFTGGSGIVNGAVGHGEHVAGAAVESSRPGAKPTGAPSIVLPQTTPETSLALNGGNGTIDLQGGSAISVNDSGVDAGHPDLNPAARPPATTAPSATNQRETTPLYVRTFKVDANTFSQGLQDVGAFSFGASQNVGQGGQGGYGGQQPGAMTARVSVAGGGGGQGGQGGGGLHFVTQTNQMEEASHAAKNYFETLGVDLDPARNPGKAVFFNDRQGTLVVRGSQQDMDIIDAAVQVLNVVPPQVNIQSKFVEGSQNDQKALGFNPSSGNLLVTNGTIGAQGGSAPSFNGAPVAVNPLGVFPGNPPARPPTSIVLPAGNQNLTSGLRSDGSLSYAWGGLKSAEVAKERTAGEKNTPESGKPAGPVVYSANAVGYSGETAPAKNVTTVGAVEATRKLEFKPRSGATEVASAQPYFEAKRELDELQRTRQILDAKIASEKIDVALPKTTVVDITDKAVPATTPSSSLWDKIRGKPGDYKSSARIKVERDQTDISGMTDHAVKRGYDPYFIQTEEELIQSEAVLGKVVDDLDLKKVWAKKNGAGEKLTEAEAVALLKQSLDLHPVKGTSLLEIGAKSDKPEEAAKIANAVADAYKSHRAEQRLAMSKGGITALEERFAEQEGKVREAQKKVDDLRMQLSSQNTVATAEGPSPLMSADTQRIARERQKALDEKLPAGMFDFQQAKTGQALDLYGKLVGREVLRSSTLPDAPITFSTQSSLTRREAIQALEGVLALNGITMVNVGDKSVKAMPEAQGNTAGAQFGTNSVGLGNYVTKVVQLKHAKPSEVVPGLQSLAKAPNAVLPLDGSRLLVLRDSAENVKRMSDAIAQADAAEGKEDAALEAARRPAGPAPVPQPEVQTAENAFSTFSLNVSDVSFKLAAASLEKGLMPDPANVRSEEFINAFDYRDPEPPVGVPVAFAWERAQYPFAQNRDLLRFSVKTAAQGREPGRPLNLVLLLDNSGSMERADRVRIIREALRVLAGQLQPQDKFSVVTFSRTAHLWVDGVPGTQAAQVAEEVSGLTPQGGTNLEDAMNLAYATALRHYLANGINRVVLLTDGAANLGNVDPEVLKQKVEANRKQGIALDAFGIGWEGYNDDLLEVLTRNGDGRYAFLNTVEEVGNEFAAKLVGALQVAASDVKVQVEFNPARVTAYRQIGYAKHQLKKEQFRDNTVNAAQIGAAEAGNALYTVEVNPTGTGPLCTVHVRFRIPGTADYREHAWDVPFNGNAVALDQASPAMRLAATGSALSEWLASSPFAGEVTPDRLLGYLNGVPEVYGADARPKKLEWMIRQAKSIAGK